MHADIVRDPAFVGCSTERVGRCISPSAHSGTNLAGSGKIATQPLDDLLRSTPEKAVNEIAFNCVSDSIRSCNSETIASKIAKDADLKNCEYLESPFQKDCQTETHKRLAILRDNIAHCSSIDSQTAMVECQDSYNQNKAVVEKDTDWCSRLSIQSLKDTCKADLFRSIAIRAKDAKWCTKESNERRDSCLESVILQTIIPSTANDCAKISDLRPLFLSQTIFDRASDNCYAIAVTKEPLVATCDKFAQPERKKACQEVIEVQSQPIDTVAK